MGSLYPVLLLLTLHYFASMSKKREASQDVSGESGMKKRETSEEADELRNMTLVGINGDTLLTCLDAGFSARHVMDAGFSGQQLKAAVYSAKQILEKRKTEQLKTAGCSPQQLVDAGHSAKDFSDAGWSAQQLEDAIVLKEYSNIKSRQSSSLMIRNPFHLTMSDIDRLRLDMKQWCSQVVVNKTFCTVLTMMMHKEEHVYTLNTLPLEWQQWDQKGWSHLGSLSQLGITADPGNFLYACALVILCSSVSNMPPEWTRLTPFMSLLDVQRSKPSQTALARFLNSAGDVLEAVAGAVNWSYPQSREFCSALKISALSAQSLGFTLSTYLDKVSLILSVRTRATSLPESLSLLMPAGVTKDICLPSVSFSSLLLLTNNSSATGTAQSPAEVVSSSASSANDDSVASRKRRSIESVTAQHPKEMASSLPTSGSDSSRGEQAWQGSQEWWDSAWKDGWSSEPSDSSLTSFRHPLRPQRLPDGDARFAPKKQDKIHPRVYVCDWCGSRHEFIKKTFQYDGQYVDFAGTRGYSPTQLSERYWAGKNLTWYCTTCHQRPWEKLEDTRIRLGVYDDKRIERNRDLIESGFFREKRTKCSRR